MMEKSVEKALRDSISRWEANAARDIHGDMQLGIAGCPLCELFMIALGVGCTGCPVADATGQTGCRGTPSDRLDQHVEDCADCKSDRKCRELRRLARMEVAFLKSLRPETI
jgi:hypothetical protein